MEGGKDRAKGPVAGEESHAGRRFKRSNKLFVAGTDSMFLHWFIHALLGQRLLVTNLS